MLFKIIISSSFFLFIGLFISAQEVTGVQADIRELTKEKDPSLSVAKRNQIIEEYNLDTEKDSETIDILNGTVAIAYVLKKDYKDFEKYIGLINNKFNQTSMLSMAANKLLDDNIDTDYACKIAKETLEKYNSYKDDPRAKPESYSKEEWKRFMNFTKYPYYDTYARALFAQKKYKEALHYQELAFDGEPDEGIPSSVERYIKLLKLNNKTKESEELLLKIARKGELNKEMIVQLESLYIAKNGTNENFEVYIDSLQSGVQSFIIKELKNKMINKTAPTFTLKDLNGKRVSLEDYKGKIVILDLWATWCAPCIASFPAMQKLVDKHTDVVFLFIAVHEKGNNPLKKVQNFIQKNDYTFKVLMDEPITENSKEYKIISLYNPNGIPSKYIIDSKGMLQFESIGFDTDSQLINEIDAMISLLNEM